MKKRIHTTLIALLALAGSATAQSLTVQGVEATAGEQATLMVSLSGATSMTALQFNLALPEGVTVAEGTPTLGTATNGHTLNVETLDNGDRLFVLYSMDMNTFRDGELLRIPVNVGSNAESGEGTLYTVRFATTEAVSNAGTDVKFNVTVQEPEQPVTITAENKTMVYGDDVPTLTYKTEGGVLNGAPKLSTTATKASPVGTYPIKVEAGSVTNTQTTYVDGTLTITKAPLTIKAGEYTKKQGEENPEFELTYEGFKNGETLAVLTTQPKATTTATTDSPVGEYEVVVNGAEAQNYNISYVNGKLIITEADGIDSFYTDYSNATIYNLSGQRLSKPQRGVNIIGGKKVVVK